MPTHLLHSGNEQAILFLGAIAVAVLIRFWRIVLTTFAFMVIVAALIVFSVILDLHVVHEVAVYLRNLVHEITGLPRPYPAGTERRRDTAFPADDRLTAARFRRQVAARRMTGMTRLVASPRLSGHQPGAKATGFTALGGSPLRSCRAFHSWRP